jgi:hypothetical protein
MGEFLLLFRMDITTPGAQPTAEQMKANTASWDAWIEGISREQPSLLAEGGASPRAGCC